eukprot:m.22827 g.22827  ORF g.22827 m.22827 type:complete len:122 (+) comp28409_c0_seq1:714-1079(+)
MMTVHHHHHHHRHRHHHLTQVILAAVLIHLQVGQIGDGRCQDMMMMPGETEDIGLGHPGQDLLFTGGVTTGVTCKKTGKEDQGVKAMKRRGTETETGTLVTMGITETDATERETEADLAKP